jgi:hypothetical protein
MNIYDIILSIYLILLIWVQLPEAKRKMNQQ